MLTVAKRKQADSGFGRKLREHREAKGWTQSHLGEQAEPVMSYQNIARLERGEREPTWPVVLRLAKALGVSPDAFLDDAGE